jgi:hypothetical protein
MPDLAAEWMSQFYQTLRVIYVPDPAPGSVFVITAYALGTKALKALRRRQKPSSRKKP